MCGICGKVLFDSGLKANASEIDRMMAAIPHRGPDGVGKYVSGPVGLGHTRLAIIDLSTGDQPMTNEDGTIWLVYNGEIYNYQELRQNLLKRGHVFRSTSDTEVIIHAYEEYGPDCVTHFRGMFAFALWDQNAKRLFVARDRVGIKPLYYLNTGRALLFASEIKSLLCDPAASRQVDYESIHRFLSFLYLPGERTLLKGVHKLEPGHYMVVQGGEVWCHQYWDLKFSPNPEKKSFAEACGDVEQLVHRSVKEHMISDVPVGVLLSGGVDSTIVLSCASKESPRPLKSFTIGFSGEEFDDERPYARLAAKRFGSEHHEITISPAEFFDFLPSYVSHMEEPVCEAPAVALHYVSKLARKHVKVVLSGEGGDEAFGGYQTYRNLQLLERLKMGGPAVNRLFASSAGALGAITCSNRFKKYAPLFATQLSDYYYSRVSTPFSFFNARRQELCTPDFFQRANAADAPNFVAGLFERVMAQANPQPLLNRMLYVDTKTWLTDDLLIKADKMTMANSLELRVPLLDHPVLEYAAGLPPSYKVKGWTTKRVLKQAFANKIPLEIIQRRKTGLPVPLRRWMRHDLSAYVSDVLLSRRAVERGYFRKEAVEQLLKANAQDGGLMKEVFSLLTLELWHIQFMDQQTIPAASPAPAFESGERSSTVASHNLESPLLAQT